MNASWQVVNREDVVGPDILPLDESFVEKNGNLMKDLQTQGAAIRTLEAELLQLEPTTYALSWMNFKFKEIQAAKSRIEPEVAKL